MLSDDTNWPAVPENEIYPEIAAVLAPQEHVYWQGKPVRGPRPVSIAAGLLFVGVFSWVMDLHEELLFIWQIRSLGEILLVCIAILAFIGLILALNHRKFGALSYALTDQRVLLLQRGRIIQQASPQQFELWDVRTALDGVGKVPWTNADEFRDKRRLQGFYSVRNARAVHQMLQDWQHAWQVQSDAQAEANSEAYRQHRDTLSAGSEGSESAEGDAMQAAKNAPAAEAWVQRITHPGHGVSLELPGDWDVNVAQHDDGPLKVLGITLLKRVIRPGPARQYTPDDPKPWNRIILRGGASTGLNISIHPPDDGTTDMEQVLDERWGRVLGVPVTSFDRGIDIAGFQGFAAVRELPAGSNAIGFGTLPTAVLSRQWWLNSPELQLEILGIAPAGSPVLQETIDRIVHSLRPR